MKETGIIRNLDELGRLVIPIESRRSLNWKVHDPIEIYVDDGAIILKKHMNSCVFCGSQSELNEYEGLNVCKKCIDHLGTLK